MRIAFSSALVGLSGSFAAGRLPNFKRHAISRKRALLAVGHSLLVIFYPMLKSGVGYQDLGVEYFDGLDPERLRRYLVKRLEGLGYQGTLTTQDEAV